LGSPGNGSRKTHKGDGLYQRFQYGTIYWSAGSGAHFVCGGVESTYMNIGYEVSQLGLPVSDTIDLGKGCSYCDFLGGSIYYSPLFGGHIVRDPILTSWRKSGAVRGMLGYPIENAEAIGKALYQPFQSGEMYWHPDGDVFELRGKIRTEYNKLGGANGQLGLPISKLLENDSGEYQKFQNGIIIWHSRQNKIEVQK
jgi:uncharacterized protein with LGFP repeats